MGGYNRMKKDSTRRNNHDIITHDKIYDLYEN